MECTYLEHDEHGDICHAHEETECENPFGCTAIYDIHGNYLRPYENGLDTEELF